MYCTAKAAWPELQVSLPGICTPCTSVEKLGIPVQQPAVGLGVYEASLIAALTSIHSSASDRALQIHTGWEVMTDWLLRLCAQLELGKAQKFLVCTKIPVAAAPQLGDIDSKMGGNHP